MPPSAPLRLMLDGDALVSNWRWLKDRSGGAACGAAVKADGYGLGARGVVDRLAAAGCRDYFVATWAEAEALGAMPGGISLSVLHGVRGEDMEAAAAGAARPVLNTPAQVARWKPTGRPCDIMVDTGMNRLGLTPQEARSGLLDGLAIETLMSHLACADEPADAMNERQRSAFAEVAAHVPAKRYSLANSAGILLGGGYAFGLTRPGLALYGGIPAPGAAEAGIAPVVALEAELLQVRDARAGETVGYGATYAVREPMRIGVLNVGYADGFLRGIGGASSARAGGRDLPIVGRVSMDLITVDLSGAEAGEGDWVALTYDLPALASAAGLSQYELLTNLSTRFERRWT